MNIMNNDLVDVNAPKKVGVKSEKIRFDKTDKTLIASTTMNNTNMNISKINKASKPVVVLNRKDNSEIVKSIQPNKDNEGDQKNLDEKKERKKEIKKENKERREQKKALKEAFKKEKIRVQKVICSNNKVIRSGLSIKEI
jgi:hypothetical protein